MADREGTRPPPSRDVAGEDFLFHLYRGSELLQDDRVHDAKAELEQALSLQPHDPKGQDLLGIVYFRLGLYPRAIVIYERLIQMYPDAVEPRINLALSYLKTGQAQQARAELERVLEHNPNHSRAWGYLGLAFQRMGDYERASHAFAAGGHDAMARRVNELAPTPSIRPPEAPSKAENDARKAAAREAFVEIDREGFRPDSEARRTPSGIWSAVEPGREPPPPPSLVPSLAPKRMSQPPQAYSRPPPSEDDDRVEAPRGASLPRDLAEHDRGPRRAQEIASVRPAASTSAVPASELARDLLLVFPRERGVALHASGLVLVQADAGFVARADRVRSWSFGGMLATHALSRRARGRTLEEPLGGATSPLVEIAGRGDLVLAPKAGHRLAPIALEEDPLYLREEALAGFELSVTYENGRLPVGDGEAIAMVQLRGPGSVVVEIPVEAEGSRYGGASLERSLRAFALEITDAKPATVRAIAVLGWTGRVVPRGLLPSEAPASARGLVAFSGEGMVLLDGR